MSANNHTRKSFLVGPLAPDPGISPPRCRAVKRSDRGLRISPSALANAKCTRRSRLIFRDASALLNCVLKRSNQRARRKEADILIAHPWRDMLGCRPQAGAACAPTHPPIAPASPHPTPHDSREGERGKRAPASARGPTAPKKIEAPQASQREWLRIVWRALGRAHISRTGPLTGSPNIGPPDACQASGGARGSEALEGPVAARGRLAEQAARVGPQGPTRRAKRDRRRRRKSATQPYPQGDADCPTSRGVSGWRSWVRGQTGASKMRRSRGEAMVLF